MLLGESPGKVEDSQGIPFVGPAGKLLDKIFDAIGYDTDNIYLSNVTFCRPVAKELRKQNYTPLASQIEICMMLVEHMIKLLDPKVIICCGLTALKAVMHNYSLKLTPNEGQWIKRTDNRWIFTMSHPARILHLSRDPGAQYQLKAKIWEYMKYFRDTVKEKL